MFLGGGVPPQYTTHTHTPLVCPFHLHWKTLKITSSTNHNIGLGAEPERDQGTLKAQVQEEHA